MWTDSVGGGTHDGNVSYTLTAHAPDGRTTTKTVTVGRSTSVPLYKSIKFENTGKQYNMSVMDYDEAGQPVKQIVVLAPGESYTLTLAHCTPADQGDRVDHRTGRVGDQPDRRLRPQRGQRGAR